MNNWTIYEHISPSGKVYVGITSKKPEIRWRKGVGYPKCKIFYKAIIKYGWDNIQHNIIATGLGEDTAKNMENDLIAFNKAKGMSYNITDGGDGMLGRPTTEKQRQHAASIWKGKKIPRDVVEKSAAKRRGRKCSPLHIERIRIGKIGNGNGNKAVVELRDGKIIGEYKSCVEAAKVINTHPNCVSAVCRGVRNSIYGHEYKYKNNIATLVEVVEKNPYVTSESQRYIEIVK